MLAAWDLHENLNSRGAILFRRLWDRALTATRSPWSHPFDPSDPVHTLHRLDTSNPQVRTALGDAIYTNWQPGQGPADPYTGSSYVQVVSWNNGSCPDTRTILTYSLSSNPRSPFDADQTRMFSTKRWATERFCRADVLAHVLSTTIITSESPTRTIRGHGSVRRPTRVAPRRRRLHER